MKSIFALLGAILLFSRLCAGEAVVVTLEGVGDRVRAQNPDLAAARLLIDEALGRLRQAGRLANPVLEFEFEQDFYLREGRADVGFAQRFPVTARLRLEKNVRVTEWKAAQSEVREVERKLIAQGREQMIRLLAARERRELLQQQLETFNRQIEVLSAAAQGGETAPAELGLVRMEAAGIALQLAQLEAADEEFIAELKCLLGMKPADQVRIGGRMPEPRVVVADADPGRRPDYEVARLGAQAAKEQVSLEQALRYDDVEAGMFLSTMRKEDVPEGYKDDVMIGVKLSIPLPLHNDNRGAIQEAQARKQRMDLELTAKAREIALEVAAQQAAMERWLQVVQRIEGELLPLADTQVKLAEQALRDGQGDIDTLLRVGGARSQLALSKLEALESFHLARVRHQAALGLP